MSLNPAAESAIESCYDAIANPGGWTAALDDLAHAMGAHSCVILRHEFSGGPVFVSSSGTHRLGELWQRNLDWVKPAIEPRAERFVRHGYEAVTQALMFSEDEIRQSRFHQEILRPAGMLHLAGGIFSVNGRDWAVPFYRSTEPFGTDVLEPFGEIARRLARVISIADKVSQANAETEIRTLERLGCAAVLIDRYGNVVRANGEAERLFCSDFGIRHGKLWASSSPSLSRLDRFVREMEDARATGRQLPAPIVVAHAEKPWLLIDAMPVHSASMEIFDGSRAVVLITDLTRSEFADTALLEIVFGLTPAESRLAMALCAGQDLAAFAITSGVGKETVRTQLKAVFAKTGARRQAELVARLGQIRSLCRH